MARTGNPGAFETIVDRYQGRLLGFCRQMLGSTEDAEDVLQEVFVNAYRAMLADEREINLRPWLYRIARNRCLNHLRKPTADAQESMDMVPAVEAASTAEKVHNREEFRQLLSDVGKLPETQRSALLLREMDALSYEEIAQAMETSVPSVKSLLVRARISLAEASQARQLTCGEVRLELAEAAEGLRKVSGPVRRHVRECEELRRLPLPGPLQREGAGGAVPGRAADGVEGLHRLQARLRRGRRRAARAAGTGAGQAGAAGPERSARSAAPRSAAAAPAGGIGAVGGAIGTKAVAGVVTAAVLTAGAGEVTQQVDPGARRTMPRPMTRTSALPALAGAGARFARSDGSAGQRAGCRPARAPRTGRQPGPRSRRLRLRRPRRATRPGSRPRRAATGPAGTPRRRRFRRHPTRPRPLGRAPSSGGIVVVTVGSPDSSSSATPTTTSPPPPPPDSSSPPPSSDPAAPPSSSSDPSASSSGSADVSPATPAS